MGQSLPMMRKQDPEIGTVESAEVDIVWEPQWNPRMISEEGKKVLGLE